VAVAILLEGLRATIDPAALAERRLVLQVEGGVLRVAAEALARAIPPDKPVSLERVDNGTVRVRHPFGTADVAPVAVPGARVRLHIVRARLGGLLPLPGSLAAGALRGRVALPGLYPGEGDYLEFDPNEAIRDGTSPEQRERFELVLPPVRGIRAEDGVLEVEF
jgi:hypothetical protein